MDGVDWKQLIACAGFVALTATAFYHLGFRRGYEDSQEFEATLRRFEELAKEIGRKEK